MQAAQALDDSTLGSDICHSIAFFFSSRRRHTRCSRDWSSDGVLFRSLANSECVQSLRQLTEEHDIGEWTLRDGGDTHYMSADLWMGGKAVAVGDTTFIIKRSDLFTDRKSVV